MCYVHFHFYSVHSTLATRTVVKWIRSSLNSSTGKLKVFICISDGGSCFVMVWHKFKQMGSGGVGRGGGLGRGGKEREDLKREFCRVFTQLKMKYDLHTKIGMILHVTICIPKLGVIPILFCHSMFYIPILV